MTFIDDMASWPSPLLDEGADVVAQIPWAPTLKDVASNATAYTLEGLEEYSGETDPDQTGAELVFTAETTPSDRQVARMIAESVKAVVGRVGKARASTHPLYETDPTGLNDHGNLACTAVALRVAMTIEGERRPGAADEADGAYRAKRDEYLGSLNELIDQARRGPTRLA